MTTVKHRTKSMPVEALIAQDRDFLKTVMKEAIQEVLEAEMTDFLGADPSGQTLITRCSATLRDKSMKWV